MFQVLFNLSGLRITETVCYTYQCLGPSQIRLLRLLPGKRGEKLECELIHTSLETAPKYDALSYAWGNNLQDCHISVKTGHTTRRDLLVTPNLLAALDRLRLPSEMRYLWVDQLCIAQQDDSEKGQQVQLMKRIYARAEKAVVWLGDEDADTPLLEAMFRRLSPGTSNVRDIPKTHKVDQLVLKDLIDLDRYGAGPAKARRDAIVRFLNRAWFRRAWVYQEAIVAAEVEVYWGYLCLDFDILARLVLSTYYLVKTEKDGLWSRKFKKSRGLGPLRAIWYDREQYHKQVPLDFIHILWRARKYLEASKPEDMVYSFLAFDDLSAEHKVRADYEISPQETFTNLACSMIKSRKSLDILKCVVATRTTLPHLPSWVPDWSNRKFSGGAPILSPGMPHHFNTCRGKKHEWIQQNPESPKTLLVKGHIIDSINTIVGHDCEQNTYYKASLRQVLKLEKLIELLTEELGHAKRDEPGDRTPPGAEQSCKSIPRRIYDDIPATALKTLLADGSFALVQPIEHSISDLLRVYKTDGDKLFDGHEAEDIVLHRYIRDAGSVAEGKRPFLTRHLDIGLGYSNLRRGDLVVILYGSKAPCVLRRKSHQSTEYRFMGQCYLDGWMYEDNPRDYKWWETEAKIFSLV